MTLCDRRRARVRSRINSSGCQRRHVVACWVCGLALRGMIPRVTRGATYLNAACADVHPEGGGNA